MTDQQITPASGAQPPAGWYPNAATGQTQWWDGAAWTSHVAPVAQTTQHVTGPMTAAPLNVNREVSYVRQQKGHSLTKHLLLGWVLLWIPAIYYTVSPNHYWHA